MNQPQKTAVENENTSRFPIAAGKTRRINIQIKSAKTHLFSAILAHFLMKNRINDINLLVFYNRNKQKRTEKRKSKLLLSVGVTKSSRRNGKELYTKASIFFVYSDYFRLFSC